MFNVGDRVRFSNSNYNLLSNAEGVVKNVDVEGDFIDVTFDDPSLNIHGCGWFPSRFKLVTKAKEPAMIDVTYRLIDNYELVVVINYGPPHVINSNNRNFNGVLSLVRDTKDWTEQQLNKLESLISDVKRVNDFLLGTELRIESNAIYWNNEPLHGTLVSRILSMLDSWAEDAQPLVNFLYKLQSNPSYRVREQLFRFLDSGKNVITENGTFLAYKKVKEDFTDIYTGQFSNKPGTVVKMPREQVDDDPNRTCSSGLHVCSYDYLSQFGTAPGNKVVVVEVDPKDVVSVPADYNDTKMRTCGYRVIKEIPLETWMNEDVLGTNSVVTDDDPWYDSGYSYEPEEYYDDDNWTSSSTYC